MHAGECHQELSVSILLVVRRSRSEKRQVSWSARPACPKKSCHHWAAEKSSSIRAVREEPQSRLVDINDIFQICELESNGVSSTQYIEIVVVFESCTYLYVLGAKSSHSSFKVYCYVSLKLGFHGVHVSELCVDINLIEASSGKTSEGMSRLIVRNCLSHEGRDLSIVRQVA